MLPRLKRLGIMTIGDLIRHFPARYEDFSNAISISDIGEAGQVVSIQGEVEKIETVRAWKRRMTITTAYVNDGTDSIRTVWFNQSYLADTFKEGTLVSLSGKISQDKRGLYLSNPSYERISRSELTDGSFQLVAGLKHTGRLIPIYPETEGISSKYLRFLIKPVIESLDDLPDPLPEDIRERYHFTDYVSALKAIHFPAKLEDAEPARKRFAFEELLLIQLRTLQDRAAMQSLTAPQVHFEKELIANFVKHLPFTLTDDQRRSAFEILQDLDRPHPMNRLLNGDVGSGKTVVALIAAYQTVHAGYQAVFMAPTEILAKQHYATITGIMNNEPGIMIGLLTGSEARQWPNDETTEEKISKKLIIQKIARGEIKIIIGTHAVIQKNIVMPRLGLVIIDEQHRFGVKQRMKLIKEQKLVPHLLSMTATPIPRTLALTIYGDLDVSLLKEKPKGRQEIITKVVSSEKRPEAYAFIEKQIQEGRQVFVICPRIDPSEKANEASEAKKPSQAKLMWADVKAVTEEFEKLSKTIFPHRRVAMLHGKLPAKEKEQIMLDFKDKKYDMLVSTSVIEVGVDVPNATIMMIESAERFGLAPLHQFRGRVGRGAHQSYCFLFTTDGGATRRLQAMEKTNDGFKLAEMDLKIRGPGEFTGTQQSGIPDLAMASLTDIEQIKQARGEAKALLEIDPALTKHPLLATRLARMQRMVHFE
ncbi:MAG: ATP-dependent DNA helicase RecG [Candidatus Yanofskybacteria bacterium RIFCSPLOWO2_01_FULL_49_25]|uniref:ATP-dependent DNA helicase RecG n=1 Tax=Candidatus Yanofskybacteria bacterium RIFCSPLOWO2_01_FULL_49_25 TaxID=1802701 RepID=A0A1F8GUH0_9BACT|nr:MAG: ATP-dependent DNA helicase RecG [Candidatus Yanofskybacteria bacterium RIFCSPLOWO2_01_FULL_49_25]